MSNLEMQLLQFYDDMTSNVRRWLFIVVATVAITMLSLWTVSINKAVNSHVAQVNANTANIGVLQTRQDSIIFNANDNWKKLSRFVCFQDRAAATLSGYDCPIK